MRFFLFFLLFIVVCGPKYVYAQINLELVGRLRYDGLTLAGCWHHVDRFGNEYALVGTSAGLSVVNLNEPTAPHEVFSVPGLTNNWREVKTYNGYAYVTTEAAFSGVTIINLNHLPDSLSYKTWTGDSLHSDYVLSAHALAATDGFLYLFGTKPACSGAVICDLKDPWNPEVISCSNTNYIHDGYIRGDTLWASEIYAGQFSAIDIKDKRAPKLLVTQPTPGAYSHNTWLSSDSRTLYNTDERSGAPLTAFDVSDLDNITLLDTYFPSQIPEREVHNVRVHNQYLINPSYGGQLTIVDAHKPDHLVEVAFASLGTALVWDADPYLPSGLIFATAKNEGLYIYKPTYVRACYLTGIVTDSLTGSPIKNARVRIVGTFEGDSTNTFGKYKTGYHNPGIWMVEVACPDYVPQLFSMVKLDAAVVTQLNTALIPINATTTQLEKVRINVFPTSFTGHIEVNIVNTTDTNLYVELTDMTGKLLYSSKLKPGQQTLQVNSSWPNAVYILTIKGSAGILHVQKMVKV
jgi:choice-of-anchor B domain-containing protein